MAALQQSSAADCTHQAVWLVEAVAVGCAAPTLHKTAPACLRSQHDRHVTVTAVLQRQYTRLF